MVQQMMGMSQIRNNFFDVTAWIVQNQKAVTVFKNNLPVVKIIPYTDQPDTSKQLLALISRTKGVTLSKAEVQDYKNIRKELRKRQKQYDF